MPISTEARLSALMYAEAAARSQVAYRNGEHVQAGFSADDLIEAAKKIEAYLTENA